MTLTKQGVLDQAALETQIAQRLFEQGGSMIQLNSALYYAFRSAQLRSTALTAYAQTLGPDTPPIGIACAGSSSMYEALNTYTGGTPNDNVLASGDGQNFAVLTAGRMGMEAGTRIFNETGRPVYWMRNGGSGTTLKQWIDDTYSLRSNLVSNLKNARAKGILTLAVMLQVGINDVDQGVALGTTALIVAQIRQLIALIRQETGIGDLMFFIGASQNETDHPDMLRHQREAEMIVANSDANVRFANSTYDLATRDKLHATEASAILVGRRLSSQVVAWIKDGAQFRAASFTSCKAVSDTVTDVMITHVNGSDFSPADNLQGCHIYDANGNELGISSVKRQTSNSVRITHGAKGGAAGLFSYMPNADLNDYSVMPHDNSALGLPFDVTSYALNIPAFGGPVRDPVPTGKVAKFDIADIDGVTSAGWTPVKFVSAAAGLASTHLLDASGNDTGWLFETVSVPNCGFTTTGAQATPENGTWPNQVLKGFLFNQNGEKATLRISGLNPAMVYDLPLIGSRAASDRATIYAVNGGPSELLDCANNTSRATTTLVNLVPINGAITFTFTGNPQAVANAALSYLNAGMLIEKQP